MPCISAPVIPKKQRYAWSSWSLQTQMTFINTLGLAADRYLASRGTKLSEHWCTRSTYIIYLMVSWIFLLTYQYLFISRIFHRMSSTILWLPMRLFHWSRIGFVSKMPHQSYNFVLLHILDMSKFLFFKHVILFNLNLHIDHVHVLTRFYSLWK